MGITEEQSENWEAVTAYGWDTLASPRTRGNTNLSVTTVIALDT